MKKILLSLFLITAVSPAKAVVEAAAIAVDIAAILAKEGLPIAIDQAKNLISEIQAGFSRQASKELEDRALMGRVCRDKQNGVRSWWVVRRAGIVFHYSWDMNADGYSLNHKSMTPDLDLQKGDFTCFKDGQEIGHGKVVCAKGTQGDWKESWDCLYRHSEAPAPTAAEKPENVTPPAKAADESERPESAAPASGEGAEHKNPPAEDEK